MKSVIDKLKMGFWTKPNDFLDQRYFPLYADSLMYQLKQNLQHHFCGHNWYIGMGSGVIHKSADPQYRAPENKYVVRDKGSYRFHVFGYCMPLEEKGIGTEIDIEEK